MSEHFSLQWDNFHKNMSAGMQSLLESEDLVDVTLAVEGRHLKAHKMVLSLCSPYFRQLFQSSPCKHPIVFMKDVSYIALSDLLQFMYQGEVQVAQENLPTFIKTAEALQIKGLTGDSTNQNEEQIETTKPTNEPTKRTAEVLVPSPVQSVTRVKKYTGPASKRVKVRSPSPSSSTATPSVPAEVAVETDNSNVPSNVENPILLKMEPNDHTEASVAKEVVDQSQDSYVDEALVEEDAEDYTLMETNEDDPKPGTSFDGVGESQDNSNERKSAIKRKPDMPRYIVDGFVFHVNIMKGKPPMTYLRCLEYKRLGCHARAIIPSDGSIDNIKIKKPHNHPPDHTAEEKIVFLRELKEVLIQNPCLSICEVYKTLSEIYPTAAREIPFRVIRHKMNRWRRNILTPTPFEVVQK